jgi:hypothetical protein
MFRPALGLRGRRLLRGGPSRLILAIKVVREEIPTIDTCASFSAS